MGFKGWERVKIQTDAGETVEAIAPVILSASRSTDLPAFHAQWFMNRLRRGYIRWNNPFNAVSPQYVSFAQARVVVFWSKNPRPMLPYLDELTTMGLHYYFTFTLNDYVQEGFEPHVPPLKQRVETFLTLAEKLGRERVIWRFDPLLLTETVDVDTLLRRIERLGDQLYRHTEKLVISFADIAVYPRVQANLRRLGIQILPFTPAKIEQLAQGLQQLNYKWGLTIATCAEDAALEEYGIVHNKCIDDDLMRRCFGDDAALQKFLGEPAAEILDLFSAAPPAGTSVSGLKDHGQRQACGCVVSKDIGQYNTCGHLCVYCYANASAEAVRRSLQRADLAYESILR